MKKGMILVLSILTFMLFSKVNAATCENQEQAEISKISSNIKATYEVKSEKVKADVLPDELLGVEGAEYYYNVNHFEVSVVNITEKTYAIITNDQNDNQIIVNYSDTTNGIYRFDHKNLSAVTKYTIEVYSSDKTGCPNEKVRTLYLTLPKYNSYYNLSDCEGNEDFYFCQEFITSEEPDYETFESKLNSYLAGEINENGEEVHKKTAIMKFIEEHKIGIIAAASIVVVAAAGVVTVNTLKKKGRKNR